MRYRCQSTAFTVFLLASLVDAQALQADRIVSGFSEAVWAGTPPNDDRIFVVEKDGLIKIVAGRTILATPFLDISSLVFNQADRGLLALAFHPDYANNGTFFLDYVRAGDMASVVSRWQVSGDPNLADAASEQILLVQPQPDVEHNSGQVLFGPDGYLYVLMGDGGNSNDPDCNAQNLGTWLGKILRIDVDSGAPYGIPPDNPFLGVTGALPEIYHLGVRMPWRASFDRATGDLYFGDVGQDEREEISFAPAGSAGLNFGWKAMEGTFCKSLTNCEPGTPACGAPEYTPPIFELFHSDTSFTGAVIGGFVYRGCALPALQGTYFLTDYIDDTIRSFEYDSGAGMINNFQDRTSELDPPGTASIAQVSSFGEDQNGEILIVEFTSLEFGELYRIIPASAATAASAQRNGSDVNDLCYTNQTQPTIGTTLAGQIVHIGYPGATQTGIVFKAAPAAGLFYQGQEILVGGPKFLRSTQNATGVLDVHAFPIPNDICLAGVFTASQGFVLTGANIVLCNAVDYTVGI